MNAHLRRHRHLLCLALVLSALSALSACTGEESPPLPSVEEVESYYTYPGPLEASVTPDGIVELRVTQPLDQLRRGGRLWARVGPYVFLFSDETRSIFADHPSVEGVRVVTRTPEGDEVARALLPRNVLTGLTWPDAIAIAGRARVEGTERPTLLEDLVRWGEDHTRYEYAPAFQAR